MKRVLSIISVAGLVLGLSILPVRPAAASGQGPSDQHYVYHCDGYNYDFGTGRYTLPDDCHANPGLQPGTHQWLTDQAVTILRGDGKTASADFLESPIDRGPRLGQTHLSALKDGIVAADTKLFGCTEFGRAYQWPLGDHELNPYRHFGSWSYTVYEPLAGWRGWLYAATGARRTTPCQGRVAPSVRTNSARMADEFFARAKRDWQRFGDTGQAMFNLGIALHLLQDATVPSHAHPELDVTRLRVQNYHGERIAGQDVYPAWAEAKKTENAITAGGTYAPPTWMNGIKIVDTPGGWVYWQAAAGYPYFPYAAGYSATPSTHSKCDVTDFPEHCRTESETLLKNAQRVSAGFVQKYLSVVRP